MQNKANHRQSASAQPMQKMQWQFVRGRGFASRLISWYDGIYSHVDWITPNGMLRGARSDMVYTPTCKEGIHPGYRDRPMDYDIKDWSLRTIFTLNVTSEQAQVYKDFSDAQLGKPYDSRGITGFVFDKRNWHEPDSWFCSEEVQANLEAAGISPPMYEDSNRVDPGDLAFILCALGANYQDLPCR